MTVTDRVTNDSDTQSD